MKGGGPECVCVCVHVRVCGELFVGMAVCISLKNAISSTMLCIRYFDNLLAA